SVASYGVNTLHLQSFPASMCDQLRHESMIGRVANGPCNEDIETPQPHRAVLAMSKTGGADPAQSFGFAALGPLLQGFENWLQAEERILASRFSGTVHRVYLMRDGFLPMKVHRAQHGESAGHAVEISRFTAIAASLDNAESVLSYAAGQGGLRPQTLARQLLFDTKEIARICYGKNDHENWQALWAELRALPVRRAIVRRSRAYADRLITYLRRMVDPAEGDVLMLIDLGYNGTVQNAIDDLLSDRLGVHVAGRYMILRELDCPGYDKRGFFDRRHFDDMTLDAMCENVAVLEQLCTSGTGSVTDYTPDGEAVRKQVEISGQQSALRARIQQGCIDFAGIASPVCRVSEPESSGGHWRKASAASLMRLMYFPSENETELLEGFRHDINLGTDRTIDLFDCEAGRRGLRERGLFYMQGARRMYLPAELCSENIPTRLALFATRRFGLPLTFADYSGAGMDVPVLFVSPDSITRSMVTAYPTHDGYYMAAVPVSGRNNSVALQMGAICTAFQIENATFCPVERIFGTDSEAGSVTADAPFIADGLSEISHGLYSCADDQGLLLFTPPHLPASQPLALLVVFRPLSGPITRIAHSVPAEAGALTEWVQ
ncbi:MAG: HAD family hydrolase, partial [Sphingomonadaceae bacterium]